MNIYIFVAAAAIAIIPILVVFKVHIKKIVENPQQLYKIQNHFFIGVALSKILPIILLVFGIIKMPSSTEITQLIPPLSITVLFMVLALYFILSQKKVKTNPTTKVAIDNLALIATPLTFAIPIMALFFIFITIV